MNPDIAFGILLAVVIAQLLLGDVADLGKFVVVLVLIVVAVIFILQNTARREINLLFWSVSLPTWIWLLAVLLIGVIIGSMFPWFRPKKK